MLRRVALAVALIALFSGAFVTTNGCGGFAPAPRPRPRVGSTALRGIVTDAESGKPLAGVRVSIQGFITETNASGEFQFNVLDPRRSVLTAAREGYLVHELPVVLAEGTDNRLDFPMRRR